MSKSRLWCLLLVFLIVFWLRVQANGGLYQASTSHDFDHITSQFWPISNYLDQQIHSLLPNTQADLLSGILIGIQSPLPPELKQALTNTSTIHIVVVSGQNLSLLVGFVMAAAPLLGRRKTILISFSVIIFYSLLTGLQIPVLRAALMASLVLVAEALGKDRQSWWILAIAAAVMLLYNPNWLLSISFQLSFMATFGALVLAKRIAPHLKFLPDIIKDEAAVSLSAQLLTMPIIAANFHQISLIGLIVNSLVLWTVSPIMISGLVYLVALTIFSPLASLISLVPFVLLTYFVDVVTFFAHLPFASLQVQNWNLYLSTGLYLLIGAIFIATNHQPNLLKLSRDQGQIDPRP